MGNRVSVIDEVRAKRGHSEKFPEAFTFAGGKAVRVETEAEDFRHPA
jgi:hypothetical protein